MNETVEQTYPARNVLNSYGMRKRDSINLKDIISIGSLFITASSLLVTDNDDDVITTLRCWRPIS